MVCVSIVTEESGKIKIGWLLASPKEISGTSEPGNDTLTFSDLLPTAFPQRRRQVFRQIGNILYN
jgi:hypothetical protein